MRLHVASIPIVMPTLDSGRIQFIYTLAAVTCCQLSRLRLHWGSHMRWSVKRSLNI